MVSPPLKRGQRREMFILCHHYGSMRKLNVLSHIRVHVRVLVVIYMFCIRNGLSF